MLDNVRHTVNLYNSVPFPMESPSIYRRIERFPAKKNQQRDLVKRDCKQQARHRKRSLGYVQTMFKHNEHWGHYEKMSPTKG